MAGRSGRGTLSYVSVILVAYTALRGLRQNDRLGSRPVSARFFISAKDGYRALQSFCAVTALRNAVLNAKDGRPVSDGRLRYYGFIKKKERSGATTSSGNPMTSGRA